MSEIADEARVAIILADYAAPDAANKVNVLGAGWQLAGFQHEAGLAAPQSLVVFVDVPPRHYNEEFALVLYLLDESQEPVQVPGPTGEPQALRISQLFKAEEPTTGGGVRRGVVYGHVQVLLNFANGLPLTPGQLYTWQVEIDGDAKPHWRTSFYVPGPPPAPVIG